MRNLYIQDSYRSSSDRSTGGVSIERKAKERKPHIKLCATCNEVFEVVEISQGKQNHRSELHYYGLLSRQGKEVGECPKCLGNGDKYRIVTDKSFAWGQVAAGHGKKKCNKCKKIKPIADFYTEKPKDYVRCCCKVCDNERSMQYQRKAKINKERLK